MINIAYACNDAYIEQTIVSMKSLFENSAKPASISIVFIDMGIAKDSQKELKKMVNEYYSKITIVNFDDIAYDLIITNETGRHIKSVYAKIFFGRLNWIDRIIYLDSDVIIKQDIKELWDMDLGENVLAGVETIHSVKENELIGYDKNDRAINDGVVLMDLQKWRERNYLNRCLDYIGSFDGNPPVLSEGTINAVCKGDIMILSPRFNLMSGLVEANAKKIERATDRPYYTQNEIKEANSNPVIIHFLAGFYNRPWCKKCSHPMKKEYLKYRAMTKYGDLPLSEKKLPFQLRLKGLIVRVFPGSWVKLIRKIVNRKEK